MLATDAKCYSNQIQQADLCCKATTIPEHSIRVVEIVVRSPNHQLITISGLFMAALNPWGIYGLLIK